MNIVKIFKRYKRCLDAYFNGYISDLEKDKILYDIFIDSGYKDPMKLLIDYEEWLNKGYVQMKLF